MKKIIKLTESDLIRIVKRAINEQTTQEKMERERKIKEMLDGDDYYKRLKRQGYKEQTQINLPDGEYYGGGGGYQFDVYTNDRKFTGYSLLILNGISGIFDSRDKIDIKSGTWSGKGRYFNIYKIMYNKSTAQYKPVITGETKNNNFKLRPKSDIKL